MKILKRVTFTLLVTLLLFVPSPSSYIHDAKAADPPLGPTLKTTEGATTCANTKVMNFSSGATLTCSGTTANVAVAGSGGTLTSVSCGTDLVCTPSPIVATGSIDLADTIDVNTATVAVTANLNGTTNIGDASTDTLTVNAYCAGSLTFVKESTHGINVATATETGYSPNDFSITGEKGGPGAAPAVTPGDGGNVLIEAGSAGNANGSSNNGTGGNLTLRAGTGNGGADGDLYVGDANTSIVYLSAASKSISFVGQLISDLVFSNSGARNINIAASATVGTVGRALTITSGAGADGNGATAGTNGGLLSLLGGVGGNDAGGGTGVGGGVTITGGNAGTKAGGLAANGGAITIDSGTGSSGGGVNGTISVGTTNASALTIGRSGVMTTVNGTTSLGGELQLKRKTVDGTATGCDANCTRNNVIIAYTALNTGRTTTFAVPTTGVAVYILKNETSNTSNLTGDCSSGNIDGSPNKVLINSAYGSSRVYALSGGGCFTW